ncbi:hypothetical protein NBRC3293_0889 [Gluconobacter oxydans NBRC 3293]|uniref:Uncharacterized protein n=1 Tax=Gluconobacter oxydans NBRC 3293 TaxID=1315969 RepID=A0A829WZU4_GLUOY|nr:hypothetical protein NBRC3293_0889 [Gluconobacter oxydans NBRC 3293]
MAGQYRHDSQKETLLERLEPPERIDRKSPVLKTPVTSGFQ